MYTDKNLQPIRDDAQYTDENGTRYPWNYPKDEIKGLFKVAETEKPEGAASFTINAQYQQVWE